MPEYIGGKAFHSLSKWPYCSRNRFFVLPEHVQENDIIFLNLDDFDNFMIVIRSNPPRHKFILITYNSDKPFTDNHYRHLCDFTSKIYSQNNTVYWTDAVQTIPIGFRDWPHDTISVIKEIKEEKKDILLYMNFCIDTNISKRQECFDTFRSESWVTKESGVPMEEFYKSIAASMYVLSPEGTGIDCHRIYESMYLDAIPIVKTSLLDPFYKKLPIVIVREWTEITEEFLLMNYDILYGKLKSWKERNNWLDASFWLTFK